MLFTLCPRVWGTGVAIGNGMFVSRQMLRTRGVSSASWLLMKAERDCCVRRMVRPRAGFKMASSWTPMRRVVAVPGTR